MSPVLWVSSHPRWQWSCMAKRGGSDRWAMWDRVPGATGVPAVWLGQRQGGGMGRAGTPWGGQGQRGRSPAQHPFAVGLPRLMGFLPGPPGAAPPDAALMPTLWGRDGTPGWDPPSAVGWEPGRA